jgi:hypothetical protein
LCLGAPLFTVAQNTALAIGVVGCRDPLDARFGAKSIGLFAIQKKSGDRKIAFWAVVSSHIKTWLSIIHRPALERQN